MSQPSTMFIARESRQNLWHNEKDDKVRIHINLSKQAGAELGQAQVKLEVVDEDLAKAELKLQL